MYWTVDVEMIKDKKNAGNITCCKAFAGLTEKRKVKVMDIDGCDYWVYCVKGGKKKLLIVWVGGIC